ncbi:MAG: dTDP-4-dehydrorhamnose 3,5-epimerase [Cellulosilyticaceae bacterium]
MGNFTKHLTTLKDVYVIDTRIFVDQRGYFMETYHQEALSALGIGEVFVQDNASYSQKGVLRGIHFQHKNPQGKLVSVCVGEVFDVAVDLRVDSPTYGKWEGFILSAENHQMVYIPPGFGHGFLTLSDTAFFSYKCTTHYEQAYDSGILWEDETIGIQWPIKDRKRLILSDKDQQLPRFEKGKNYF